MARNWAFAYCTKLTTVKSIPRTFKEIKGFAFYNCTALKTFVTKLTEEEWGKQVNDPLDATPSCISYHEHFKGVNWTYDNSKDPSSHFKKCECGYYMSKLHEGSTTVNTAYNPYLGNSTKTETCSVCGWSKTTETGSKKTCNVMPDSFGSQDAAYNEDVTVSVEINVPSDAPGAEVWIAGSKANKNGNSYSVPLGNLTSSKNCSVEIKAKKSSGSSELVTIETSTLTVSVDNNLIQQIISWFSNWLFNLFKWREITLTY